MGEAIGQMLPMAVGAAISPFPIIAVVLMLVTPRGRVNGLAFVLGWLAGLVVVGALVLTLASGAGASDDGQPATWVDLLKLALGALCLFEAVRQFRERPRGGEAPPPPKWMRSLDHVTPVRAAGLGVALSALNPKNLLLTVAGAAAIAQTGIDAAEQAIAYAVFVLVASAGVALPLCAALVMGDRSREPLTELREWLGRNNAVIMSVLLALIGAKLVGDAISGV
jgi:threonine/homoserine/homoserine lactone efflux protein